MIDLQQLKSDIADMVGRNWKQWGRPLLLSGLGSLLGSRRLQIEADTGLKLKPFVMYYLKDDFRIIQKPTDPNVIGLLPKEASISGDLSFYFTRPALAAGAPPRFKSSFWAAFAKPIPLYSNRFIDLNTLRFVDQPETALPPQGWLHIRREFIPPENTTGRDAAVLMGVEQWLQEHSIDRSIVVAGRSQSSTAPFPISEGNLLQRLLSSLDQDDLRRITMPMDVVAKLLRNESSQ